MRVLFLLAIYFIGATTSSARTLDDIIAKTSGSSKQPSTAYKVSMSTTVAMGAQTMKDSGTLEFSPPDCYHVVLSGGKVDQSGCGDTAWITGPDGSITRKISSSISSQFTAPAIADLFKKQNARLVSDTGTLVVIEMMLDEGDARVKAQFSIDTTEWLLRKTQIFPDNGIPVESGYAYVTFEGKPVISSINTVMPMGGFVRILFDNYTKIKKIPRSKFRKL